MGNATTKVLVISIVGEAGCAGSLCVVSAVKASRFAEEPELTNSVCFTPRKSARLPSNASPSGPSVSQKSSVELTAATQFTVQAALQKWLSQYIKVESVVATANEGVLSVTVAYAPLDSDVTQVQTFLSKGNL